jgi:hypothetical protein
MSSIAVTESPETPSHRARGRGLVGSVAALVVGILVLVLSQGITEPDIATGLSPRWWPQILGVIICALSIGVAVKSLVVGDHTDEDVLPSTRLGVVRVVAVVGTTFAYGVLWYFLDFRIATLVLVAALAFIIGGRGWRALLLFPALVTAALYVLFVLLLKVPL